MIVTWRERFERAYTTEGRASIAALHAHPETSDNGLWTREDFASVPAYVRAYREITAIHRGQVRWSRCAGEGDRDYGTYGYGADGWIRQAIIAHWMNTGEDLRGVSRSAQNWRRQPDVTDQAYV